MGEIISLVITVFTAFIISYFVVRLVYYILFFDTLRLFLIALLIFIIIILDESRQVHRKGLLLFLGQFIFTFYQKNKEDIKETFAFLIRFFTKIYSFIAFIVKTIGSVIKFFIQLSNGFHGEKKQLEQEKQDFEAQKQWLESERIKINEEWEKIQKTWEEILRKAHQYNEKNKYDDFSHKKEHKKEEKKDKTRHFEEFAKFDLEDYKKNNPFEVLNCKRGDEKSFIIKQYKALMLKYHPDKFKNENNEEKLLEAHRIAVVLNWAREECLKI